MRLLIPMLLVACGDKDTGEPEDTGEPAPLGQDGDDDGYLLSEDCNDTNPAINPGAEEVCEGVDNNCDGQIDEDVKNTYYQDSDGDGYGNEAEVAKGCSAPNGYVSQGGDCDDSTATGASYNPDVAETCDGEDNDCDDEVDEGVTLTFYADSDGDGFGVPGDEVEGCSTPSGYSEESTDCADDDFSIYPGAPEVCGDDEINDCDGSADDAASYCDRLSGALTLNAANTDQYWIGRHNGDYAGYSVAAVGDLTGDGRSEVLIGVPSEDVQASDAGGFYLIDGASTSTDPDEAAIAIILGDVAGDQIGLSMTAAGDLDGDGYPDFIVGSPVISLESTEDGGAFVFYGPLTGSSTVSQTADYTITGAHGGSATAYSMDSAGDFNGDGHPDVLVGAYYNLDRHDYPGAAHLLYGPIDQDISLESGSDVELMGITADAWTGYAVAGIGDFNGDGFDDVALGAPLDSGDEGYEGITYIIYGGESIVSDDVDDYAGAMLIGAEAYSYSGIAVSGGEDADGDGLDDLLVSDYAERTWLVYGEELSDEVIVTDVYDGLFYGEVYGDYSGYAIELTGDIDGDGSADVLIGAPNNDDTAKSSGSAYLFYGPLSGVRFGYAADVRFRGSGSGDLAGIDLSAGGDITGDGLVDVLIGAPDANGAGSVYMISSDGRTGGY